MLRKSQMETLRVVAKVNDAGDHVSPGHIAQSLGITEQAAYSRLHALSRSGHLFARTTTLFRLTRLGRSTLEGEDR